jgi:hypothetical protein
MSHYDKVAMRALLRFRQQVLHGVVLGRSNVIESKPWWV